MMMSSSFIIFQFSIVILLMTTLTTTINIPQATSMSQSYDDKRNPADVFPDHDNNLVNLPPSSKYIAFNTDDDNLSDEEYEKDYLKLVWPEIIDKRYADKVIRGGDSRLWAIPYRFGKRAAMPYRFGKRTGLGKKSAFL